MLEFEEMPGANDLELVVSLAEKINAKVIGISGKSLSSNSAPIQLGFEKFPVELGNFAVSDTQLDAISKTFEDEPSAEELCALLTN